MNGKSRLADLIPDVLRASGRFCDHGYHSFAGSFPRSPGSEDVARLLGGLPAST